MILAATVGAQSDRSDERQQSASERQDGAIDGLLWKINLQE
jgi:hypothetical protein